MSRLESLEKARRQLLANLIHELGRPLGMLRSGLQALRRGATQDPALLDELLVGIDDETACLQKRLEDLAYLPDQVLGTLELNCQQLALSRWLPRTDHTALAGRRPGKGAGIGNGHSSLSSHHFRRSHAPGPGCRQSAQ